MAVLTDSTPRTRFPARAALRSATTAAHARVDTAFGAHDLGSAAGYRRFLSAQAAAFLPTEAAIGRGGAERVIPGWTARQRGDLLRADLAALDIVPVLLPQPELSSPGALWGALYVLEGSRLGGAMLVRGVAPGLPTRFLGATHAPGAWRALLAALDDALVDEAARTQAVAAAEAVFALFTRAAEDIDG